MNDTGNARTKLMEEVAEQMDAIESDFGDQFEITRVMTVVEIARPDGSSGMRVRNVDMTPLEGIGFLTLAQELLKAQALGPEE